jgi:hypothetical protein
VAWAQAGRLDQSVRVFGNVPRLRPGHPRPSNAEAHCNPGDVLYQMCRLDGAVAAFRRALAVLPAHPVSRHR